MRAIPLCNWEPGLWEGSGRESSLAHPRRARGIVEQGELRRALALRRRGELLLGCGGGKVSRAVRLCQTTAACGADVSPVPSPTPKTETRAQPEHWFRRPRGQRRMDTNVHFGSRTRADVYLRHQRHPPRSEAAAPLFFPRWGRRIQCLILAREPGKLLCTRGALAGRGRAGRWGGHVPSSKAAEVPPRRRSPVAGRTGV